MYIFVSQLIVIFLSAVWTHFDLSFPPNLLKKKPKLVGLVLAGLNLEAACFIWSSSLAELVLSWLLNKWSEPSKTSLQTSYGQAGRPDKPASLGSFFFLFQQGWWINKIIYILDGQRVMNERIFS